jgi:hypothetical protein
MNIWSLTLETIDLNEIKLGWSTFKIIANYPVLHSLIYHFCLVACFMHVSVLSPSFICIYYSNRSKSVMIFFYLQGKKSTVVKVPDIKHPSTVTVNGMY